MSVVHTEVFLSLKLSETTSSQRGAFSTSHEGPQTLEYQLLRLRSDINAKDCALVILLAVVLKFPDFPPPQKTDNNKTTATMTGGRKSVYGSQDEDAVHHCRKSQRQEFG